MTKGEAVKRVVGLKTRQEHREPPSVILKGVGKTADQIIDRARQLAKGPAVVQDEGLVEQLYRLSIDASIDPSLFQLVAILLVHVYAADEVLMKDKNTSKQGETL